MNNRIRRLLEQAEMQKPSSETGENSVTSASRAFSGISDAESFFNHLRQKLLRVREWNAKSGLTSFELFDENGNLCDRQTAVVGDSIRLSMVGSGKYDWIKVIKLFDEADGAIISIKPSCDPTQNEPANNATSHFFTSASTNNFCVERDDKLVSFFVIGLSEETNIVETKNFIEKARNFAVSNIGFYFGIQKNEWKTFCGNFLEINGKE